MSLRSKSVLQQIENGVDIAKAYGEVIARYEDIRGLITGAALFLRLIGYPLMGRVADLGAGTGVASCIISKIRRINHVLAIEYSEPHVSEIMPVVFEHFKAKADKIQRVVGDFNNLQCEDNSIDTVIEVCSFHHSEVLELTLKESWRVLRPGGVLIAIDRAWPDDTSKEFLEERRNVQLVDDLKRIYGISQLTNFTRHDWGEHEYTHSEWISAFEEAGFHTISLTQRFPHVRGLNRILNRLPTFHFSLILSSIFYRMSKCNLWVYGFRPREVVFICIKR
jgi:SAM-dependent methyltransferase